MFTSTETKEIERSIREAYLFDSALLDKWLNVAGSGLDACVKDQVHALTDSPSFVFYRVEENGKYVGYFGHEHGGAFMATIFILPEYRPRKAEFWKQVEAQMMPFWRTGGYHKNQPACKFYEKMGGQKVGQINTPHGPVTVFEFQRSASWQLQRA